ncbi:outer-membrane lipoprotein carrier protein precursor [Marinomonas sp. MED121]|uniref:outer membrane lipoprotein chaperone LolA n=1 Tax=Marinomonas sp. MED121 TaxID=314277 RepID=UPI000068FBC5|nr:outer membrane lipoprotein chaperone LolA [Marinomonas sp. MED121]EAQ63813.1 outer-membrane lipoprotein carrier protein precursor [Marinomonas sp. MED121]
MMQKIVVLLAILFSINSMAATELLTQLLETNRNIEGEFRQVTYDEQGEQLQANEGVFLLAEPNRFVWDTITPFPQRIISNGEWITIWDVDLEQATQKPLEGALGNSPAALLGQPANEVLPHYNISQLGEQRFRLEPKEEVDLFSTLTLSFRQNAIEAMSIQDSLGQTTVIEFKNVESHDGVADGNFQVDLPAEVDLIVESGLIKEGA